MHSNTILSMFGRQSLKKGKIRSDWKKFVIPTYTEDSEFESGQVYSRRTIDMALHIELKTASSSKRRQTPLLENTS